jgi:hypothetical protein
MVIAKTCDDVGGLASPKNARRRLHARVTRRRVTSSSPASSRQSMLASPLTNATSGTNRRASPAREAAWRRARDRASRRSIRCDRRHARHGGPRRTFATVRQLRRSPPRLTLPRHEPRHGDPGIDRISIRLASAAARRDACRIRTTREFDRDRALRKRFRCPTGATAWYPRR